MYRFLIPALALTFGGGFLAGSAVTAWQVHTPPPLAVVDDISSGIAAVSIEGIRNGELIGSVTGDVRLSAGGRPIAVGSGGVFAISDRKVLTNVIAVRVPDGMRFAASRRGKKYYPVDSSDAQRIVPANRIYFKDEESARQAGYVR